MIKIAVTRPDVRKKDIATGVKSLEWPDDPFLKAFELQVGAQPVTTKARLLANPEITFARSKHNPGVSGRWDLRGKKFVEANKQPLESWSFVGLGDTIQRGDLEAFARNFTTIYRGHGGVVKAQAQIFMEEFVHGDYGQICEDVYKKTGLGAKATPQMIFFILPTKNSLVYERIKKNMDCRFAVVSQCMQVLHVKKNQPQYCSNIAMKVNSKLGGVTCRIAGPSANAPPFFSGPTMMIGLDVSHASPGSSQPSMAAMTVSMDKFATRYAAQCETNGWRQEILSPPTLHEMFPRILLIWTKVNGCTPKHVYFFRDGVSEGQFQHVMDRELKEFKRCFRHLNMPEPKFTVIVATKRHHIRFFPKPGDKSASDRNNNPLPGTLVEHDATHPFHFDFYLCSHVAIQGTARPVHYNVIYDDANVPVNLLQKMIYQQCYQYCRSTTPVSLHPAIYYAHLASNRARAHENIAASQREVPNEGGKGGFPFSKMDYEIYSGPRPIEAPRLVPMGNNPNCKPESTAHINTTMWYV
jgi:eukaryotic translation initiation factor 2C